MTSSLARIASTQRLGQTPRALRHVGVTDDHDAHCGQATGQPASRLGSVREHSTHVRDRCRIDRHRRRQGAHRSRPRLRLLRARRPGRRQLGLPELQRHLGLLPVAAHQHLARAHGVLRLPDAEVLPRLPAPRPHRRVLRLLRRPLRLPRPDPLRGRRRARRAAGRRHASRSPPATGETRSYDAVVVANGHHWDPRWPEPAFPGSDTFEGEQIHSHPYEHESQLAGKDVVVLGMGNSAMDIAVDASYHSENTILAARRGAHIIPKYVFGRPLDRASPADRLPPLGPLQADARSAQDAGREDDRLRPARARPQARPRAPDRQRPDPRPTRPRGDHGQAEHRPPRGRDRPLRRRHRGPRRPRRLLHGLQDHLPVPRSRGRLRPRQRARASTSACSTPRSTTSTSPASCSRSARSCPSPSARGT